MSSHSYFRDTWVEINLDAIENNIMELKTRLPKGKKIYAVVKANGYGHGDVQVAKVALEAGAYGLAVSLLDEAISLRLAEIQAPILVMGRVRPEDAVLAAKYDITLAVFQKEWMEEMPHLENPLNIHLKIDTGMGRVGLRTEEEMDEIISLVKTKNVRLTGVFTHFATADEPDLDYYNEQNRRFSILLERLKFLYPKPFEVHTGNSAAALRFPEEMYDSVRYGISMYGLYPSDWVKQHPPFQLTPALSLQSKLIHVKKLPPGESISYGATYTTETEEWIGTVPIGYADGWIRKLQGSEVLVAGERAQVVGRICMDQMMIRLQGPIPVGTQVTMIGQQQNQSISMDEIAQYLDTINYEISCMISNRVPRVYFRKGNVLEVVNGILPEKV
ncbi:alanine racemase [Bacillaceae bacterium S4-13-56]